MATPLPLPPVPAGNGSGIPFPDIDSNECVLGVSEVFLDSYNVTTTPFLNVGLPSPCSGHITRWEICYKYHPQLSTVTIGVWRSERGSPLQLVEQNEITIAFSPLFHHQSLICSVLQTNSSQSINIITGDIISVFSPNVPIAFSNSQIPETSNDHGMYALIRAIVSSKSAVDNLF